MNKYDDLDRTLADLDAAPAGPLTRDQENRAQAGLAQILATDPSTPDTHADAITDQRPRRTVRTWRLAAAGGVAALAAVVVVPLVGGGDTAYATWTETPSPLEGLALDMAVDYCVENNNAEEATLTDPTVLVAETRGEWTYVLLQDGDAQATCVTHEDGERDENVGHYDPDARRAPQVGGGKAREISSMLDVTDEDELLHIVEGVVGADVTEVMITSPTGLEIEASIANGYYAAWWPGGKAEGDNPELGEAWVTTVTLKDGTSFEY